MFAHLSEAEWIALSKKDHKSQPVTVQSKDTFFKEAKQPPHVLVLSENEEDDDLIVGDLQGSLTCGAPLFQFPTGTRVFLSGNFIGKNSTSKNILDSFIAVYTISPGLVYAVRGKEEELFIEYATSKLKKNKTTKEAEEFMKISQDYIKRHGVFWAAQLNDVELEKYSKFLLKLPHIIHVKGENPFHVVSTELLLSDVELLDRIDRSNFSLSEAEIQGMTKKMFDMKEPAENKARNESSIPVYCGYFVPGGVRTKSNHINLNVDTYKTGMLLGIYHKGMKPYFPAFDQSRMRRLEYEGNQIICNGVVTHVKESRAKRAALTNTK